MQSTTMQHRTPRALASVVVLAVVAVGCAGDAPDAPEPAAEQTEEPATEQEAPPTAEPEEDAAPPPATAEEVAAAASGPSGFDEREQQEGGHPALMYASDLTMLTGEFDPTPELERIDATDFRSATTRTWERPNEVDTLDVAQVVVADFGSPEAAAAEFELLRGLADQRVAQGAQQVDAELGGGASFALAAPFGMVPIDPGTGEAEREPPTMTLGVVHSGRLVVLVSTSIEDTAADGGAAFAELAASLGL